MPSTPIQTNSGPLVGHPFIVRYDQTTVAHTQQFVLCAADEQLVLECSSGLITGGNRTQELPIHTRLALPWSAAERLYEMLGQAMARQKSRARRGPRVTDQNQVATQPAAGLPRFETADA